MNLPLLDVPDDSAAIADWLERQLVGLHLADLVSQLSAVYRADDNTATLAEVLGPNSDQIMQRGLAAAPLETLRELLHSPRLLLELQDRIFVAGGAHWQRVPIDDEQRQVVERQAKALRAKIDGEIMGSHEALQLPPRRTWRRLQVAVGVAVAVSLAVAAFVWQRSSAGPAWGWGKPDSIVARTRHGESITASGYLKQLAAEAAEWRNKRPASREQLETRLREMLTGCNALLASSNTPLPPESKTWLRDKCTAWAAKFEQQLTQLEQGADLQKILSQSDETVDRLIAALNSQADKV